MTVHFIYLGQLETFKIAKELVLLFLCLTSDRLNSTVDNSTENMVLVLNTPKLSFLWKIVGLGNEVWLKISSVFCATVYVRDA